MSHRHVVAKIGSVDREGVRIDNCACGATRTTRVHSGGGGLARSEWRGPRGPGRPSVDPEADVERITVRCAQTQIAELERIVTEGRATGLAEAVRVLIDESAQRRR